MHNVDDEGKETQELHAGADAPAAGRSDLKDNFDARELGAAKEQVDQELRASLPETSRDAKEPREHNLHLTKKSSTNHDRSQSLGAYSPALGPTKFGISRGNAKVNSSSKDSDQIIKQTIRSAEKTYQDDHASTYHGIISVNDYAQISPSRSKKRRRSVLRLQYSERPEPMAHAASALPLRSMHATGYSNGGDSKQNAYNDPGEPARRRVKHAIALPQTTNPKKSEYNH